MLSEVSCHAALASRSWASGAGARVVAAEVSVVLSVEELPETASGAASRFLLNSPPARVDSAARESEAMGPAASCLGILERGSVVFYGGVGVGLGWLMVCFKGVI